MALSHEEILRHVQDRRKLANPENYIPLVNTASDAVMLFSYLGNDHWASLRDSGADMTNRECRIRLALEGDWQDVSKLDDDELQLFVKNYLGSMRTKLSHLRSAIKASTNRNMVKYKMLYKGWQRHSNKTNIVITLAYTENETKRVVSQIMHNLLESNT
jgi:hypothetical protein